MDFKSTYTLESTAFPGVIVTLRRMGPKRRAEVELSVSAARARQRELAIRREILEDKLKAALIPCPKDAAGAPIETEMSTEAVAIGCERLAVIDEAQALVRSQIHPAFVRAALKSFGGTEALTYEGKPATADLLCDVGPDELFDEVVRAVHSNGYLPAEAAAPLLSPTTSADQVAGEPVNTTAQPANSGDSTLDAGA